MFSGVLMVAGMGFIVDRLLLALGRWLFAWQDKTGF
jgi:ABC-type nitrate/sulfonate/bicarbonate transport system permease component